MMTYKRATCYLPHIYNVYSSRLFAVDPLSRPKMPKSPSGWASCGGLEVCDAVEDVKSNQSLQGRIQLQYSSLHYITDYSISLIITSMGKTSTLSLHPHCMSLFPFLSLSLYFLHQNISSWESSSYTNSVSTTHTPSKAHIVSIKQTTSTSNTKSTTE